MIIHYKVPKHLAVFLGEMSEAHLNEYITILIENALKHEQLDKQNALTHSLLEKMEHLLRDISQNVVMAPITEVHSSNYSVGGFSLEDFSEAKNTEVISDEDAEDQFIDDLLR